MSRIHVSEIIRAVRAIPDYQSRLITTQAYQIILSEMIGAKFDKHKFFIEVMMI